MDWAARGKKFIDSKADCRIVLLHKYYYCFMSNIPFANRDSYLELFQFPELRRFDNIVCWFCYLFCKHDKFAMIKALC